MKKILISGFLPLLMLNGCGLGTDVAQQSANHIARPAFMVERKIAAGNFELQAWERMHQRHDVATIYIEGDTIEPSNLAKQTGSTNNAKPPFQFQTNGFWGKDASRDNPIGLMLASRDLSENLVYLARPCQYVKFAQKKGCNPAYWNEDRYAPEVIEAYQYALHDIAKRWNITNFHLVGYNGGANIAAVLSATRDDVLSLRTVAGDLNPAFVDNVNVPPVSTNAVLAIDYGSQLATIPQHHFIGAADDVVTPGTYHSYRQAVGMSDCIHYSLIQDADHINGWVDKWPQLVSVEPQCATLHDIETPLPDLKDFPGNYDKVKGFGK